MGPMLHSFIYVADLCYLIFPNFLVYFTNFLSLENETGTDFWTQRSQRRASAEFEYASQSACDFQPIRFELYGA